MQRVVGSINPSSEASSHPHGTLADFTVLKQLGKGSYGTVLQVRHNASGVIYALKKCDISKMAKREIADCLGEVRFLASVHHTNIIKFVDAFVTRDMPTYLCTVMEFADGGDLSAKVERHKARNAPLSEDVIFAYFLQMVEAISHLHKLKVLHRDLKTANIFLTANGQIKVGDLGVSSGSLSKGKLANTQIGTPFYMSPEIWANKPYDDKSDIWALGCILYELAALKPPFNGRDISDLSKKVQAGTFTPIPSTFSKDLHSLISACLQVNPKRRPSADELLAFPSLIKNRERLRDKMAQTLYNALLEYGDDIGEDDHLLGTIAVPSFGNMKKLSDALPAAQYESVTRNGNGDGNNINEKGGGGGGGRGNNGNGGILSSALNRGSGSSPKAVSATPRVPSSISENDKDIDFLALGVRDSKPVSVHNNDNNNNNNGGSGGGGGGVIYSKPPLVAPAPVPAPIAPAKLVKRSDSNNSNAAGIVANSGDSKLQQQQDFFQQPLSQGIAQQQQQQQKLVLLSQQEKQPISRVQQKILQQLQNEQQNNQFQPQIQMRQQQGVFPGAAAGVVPGLISYSQQPNNQVGQVRLVQYQQRQQQYQQQLQQQPIQGQNNNLRPPLPVPIPASGPFSRQNSQYVMDPRPFGAFPAAPASILQPQQQQYSRKELIPPTAPMVAPQQQGQVVGVLEARKIADDEAKAKLRALQDKQDKFRQQQPQQQQQQPQQQQPPLSNVAPIQRQHQYRYGGGAAAMPQAPIISAAKAAPTPNWWG